jgi:UDP-N-acetylglucosamine/UDP-N-acetylgalactosamine 4-epimerase
VVQANFLAATTQNPAALNTVYNVAFGESTNLLELVVKLRELLSAFDPKIAEVEIIHGPDRVGDVRHSLADISKAKELLGYSPEFNFSTGLKLAIEWYWQNYRS